MSSCLLTDEMRTRVYPIRYDEDAPLSTPSPGPVPFAVVVVPAFDNGFLPLGEPAGALPVPGDPDDANAVVHHGHDCTLDEISDALVVPFLPVTRTRANLFHNMASMARAVERIAPCTLYIVTGTFVTELDDPDDLHLVAILANTTLATRGPLDKWLIKTLMGDRSLSFDADHKLTSEFTVAFRHDHPDWQQALGIISHIRNAACYPGEEDRAGGYLQFTLCEGGDHEPEIVDLLAPAA